MAAKSKRQPSGCMSIWRFPELHPPYSYPLKIFPTPSRSLLPLPIPPYRLPTQYHIWVKNFRSLLEHEGKLFYPLDVQPEKN